MEATSVAPFKTTGTWKVEPEAGGVDGAFNAKAAPVAGGTGDAAGVAAAGAGDAIAGICAGAVEGVAAGAWTGIAGATVGDAVAGGATSGGAGCGVGGGATVCEAACEAGLGAVAAAWAAVFGPPFDARSERNCASICGAASMALWAGTVPIGWLCIAMDCPVAAGGAGAPSESRWRRSIDWPEPVSMTRRLA